jgi:four helix bundle protein
MGHGSWRMAQGNIMCAKFSEISQTERHPCAYSPLHGGTMSGTFEDLNAWKKAMELVYDIYVVTAKYPKSETYGLAIQMRRAAVSIPSNIAEGKGRSTDKDFAHFLCQARGSLHELQTQILIAGRLEYMQLDVQERLMEETRVVGRLLHGLLSFAKDHVSA